MSTLSVFSERLKKLRTEMDMNQAEIGKALGVSRGSISFYENADRSPDIDFVARCAEFFKVTTDYLLGLTENPCLNMDKQIASYVSHLSQESLDLLASYASEHTPETNQIFESPGMDGVMISLCMFVDEMKEVKEALACEDLDRAEKQVRFSLFNTYISVMSDMQQMMFSWITETGYERAQEAKRLEELYSTQDSPQAPPHQKGDTTPEE